jgi:hypothetical protein
MKFSGSLARFGLTSPHLRLKIYFYIYRRSGEDPDVAIWVHSNRGCVRRSLDLPLLAEACRIAGLDYHRGEAGEVLFEVEALAAWRIEDLARNRVEPPLCAGPVAGEQLDGRSVRRSGSSNVETLEGHIGRSDAPYFSNFPIIHLINAGGARKGKRPP